MRASDTAGFRRRDVLALALGAALLVPTRARAEELDPVEVMRKARAATRFPQSMSEATFTISGLEDALRTLTVAGQSRIDAATGLQSKLVRVVAPADSAELAFLSRETPERIDAWVYDTDLRKVRQLGTAELGDRFAGTDFTYGDLVGIDVDDWTHVVLKRDFFRNADSIVIESTAKSNAVKTKTGYARRLSWVRLDNSVITKIRYYDHRNVLLKVYKSKRLKPLDAAGTQFQPMFCDTRNEQNGRRTVVEYSRFDIDTAVAEAVFQPDKLGPGL